MLREDLAEFIKRKRIEALISQEELAIKAGITVRTVWALEAGGTDPHFKTLRAVGKVLGIPSVEFLAPEEVAS